MLVLTSKVFPFAVGSLFRRRETERERERGKKWRKHKEICNRVWGIFRRKLGGFGGPNLVFWYETRKWIKVAKSNFIETHSHIHIFGGAKNVLESLFALNKHIWENGENKYAVGNGLLLYISKVFVTMIQRFIYRLRLY